jgi:hypothetical protein
MIFKTLEKKLTLSIFGNRKEMTMPYGNFSGNTLMENLHHERKKLKKKRDDSLQGAATTSLRFYLPYLYTIENIFIYFYLLFPFTYCSITISKLIDSDLASSPIPV